jgi:hypothetical protein
MIYIVLMNANNLMRLLFDFNRVNISRLLKLVSAWIRSCDEEPSESDLVPETHSAHINVVEHLDKVFKADPESAALLVQ